MWNFVSASKVGTAKTSSKVASSKASQSTLECSDDEISSNVSRDEGLECPICYESFNMVENVPYVLWCGHTLCKNCVLGLQWAVVKFPTLPIQLPLFISCPWCHLFSFRLVYKGHLKFPRKNFFLLWMIESMNGDRTRSYSFTTNHQSVLAPISGGFPSGESHHIHHHHINPPRRTIPPSRTEETRQRMAHGGNFLASYINVEGMNATLRKIMLVFVHLTAKFPLLILFLITVLYAIPTSVAILALYILITFIFAVPSFLVLYFAYPCLDWLVKEILA